MAFDPAVVDKQHVVWQRLTPAQQADLLRNFPHQDDSRLDPPAADVFGDDVDPMFEQWLDGAYLLRHSNDGGTNPLVDFG